MRERIGPYLIEGVLSDRGMSLVYKGRHEILGRAAAIKTLLPKDVGDAAVRARLVREGRAQSLLVHPHIVTLYDVIEDHSEIFLAIEFVEGETLAALLDRQPDGRLRLDEALRLFNQAAEALAFVHEKNVVHRDVKPSNMMVCRGHLKLTDFGIAFLVESTRITRSNVAVGTPRYMSPEQLEGKRVDHRSDIYSAALVLYRMLAGRPAFDESEYFAQVHARLGGPADLRVHVPDLPSGVCDAIAIALRYEPDERFPSIATFRDALNEGQVGFFVSPPPPPAEVLPPAEEEPTVRREPLVAPPPEVVIRARSATPLAIAGSALAVVTAAAVVVYQHALQPSSAAAVPVQTAAITATATAPIVSGTLAQRPQPPKRDPALTAAEKSHPVVDVAAQRRAELDTLREAVEHGLATANEHLAADRLDAATEELDRVAGLAQPHAEELEAERVQVAALRAGLNEKRVAAATAAAEDAHWAMRLAGAEEALHAERWLEFDNAVRNIVNDPHAPEPIAARARDLQQRGKELRRDAWKGTDVGITNNTVRKPSSPPRK